LDGRGGQVLIVATPGDESNRGRLGGSPGRRMRDARRQVVFWKVDGSCRFPRSVPPPGPDAGGRGPLVEVGPVAGPGHTGDELRGWRGARREFGCCRGFFFYFLLIPSRSRKKEILVDAFMPSLELCGLEGHSHGGEWIGVVAAADRATETSTTRAFVRFRRAPPCVLATIRRPAGRSIDPAALHAMRSIFSPRHVYIYLFGCCFSFTPSGLGMDWTGPRARASMQRQESRASS
jgi:hypothetical protein